MVAAEEIINSALTVISLYQSALNHQQQRYIRQTADDAFQKFCTDIVSSHAASVPLLPSHQPNTPIKPEQTKSDDVPPPKLEPDPESPILYEPDAEHQVMFADELRSNADKPEEEPPKDEYKPIHPTQLVDMLDVYDGETVDDNEDVKPPTTQTQLDDAPISGMMQREDDLDIDLSIFKSIHEPESKKEEEEVKPVETKKRRMPWENAGKKNETKKKDKKSKYTDPIAEEGRIQKAMAEHYHFTQVQSNEYIVRTEANKKYFVTLPVSVTADGNIGGPDLCTCPDNQKNGSYTLCKHFLGLLKKNGVDINAYKGVPVPYDCMMILD